MLRDSAEKRTLVRKFEEIAPFLKNLKTFGWYVPPKCDPMFAIYPDVNEQTFRPFWVNVKTGEHSEIIYRDQDGRHIIRKGIVPITDEWVCDDYKFPCPHI